MYYIKTRVKINKTKASQVIGISRTHLTNILNGKAGCTQATAYCITKYLDNNAEINDYFTKKGE